MLETNFVDALRQTGAGGDSAVGDGQSCYALEDEREIGACAPGLLAAGGPKHGFALPFLPAAVGKPAFGVINFVKVHIPHGLRGHQPQFVFK